MTAVELRRNQYMDVLDGPRPGWQDEALWRARINPHARRISPRRARALSQAIREVLAEAIEREGTSFRDYRMVNGESGRNADYLVAYGQVGKPCPRAPVEGGAGWLERRDSPAARPAAVGLAWGYADHPRS